MASASGKPRDDALLPVGLVLLGLVGLAASYFVLPEWRANHCFVEGRCVLLDKRLVEDASTGYKGSSNSTYRAEFLIRYTVAGRDYQVWTCDVGVLEHQRTTALRWPKERVLDSYSVGQEYPCWYDPADPSQAVLVLGYSCFSYALLLGLVVSLFLIGAGVRRRQRWAGGAAAAPASVRERRTPVTLHAEVDPDLGRAFDEYVDNLRPRTTTHAVIEMLIERHLTELGKWPAAQTPPEQPPPG